jgi:hypothetical protein
MSHCKHLVSIVNNKYCKFKLTVHILHEDLFNKHKQEENEPSEIIQKKLVQLYSYILLTLSSMVQINAQIITVNSDLIQNLFHLFLVLTINIFRFLRCLLNAFQCIEYDLWRVLRRSAIILIVNCNFSIDNLSLANLALIPLKRSGSSVVRDRPEVFDIMLVHDTGLRGLLLFFIVLEIIRLRQRFFALFIYHDLLGVLIIYLCYLSLIIDSINSCTCLIN